MPRTTGHERDADLTGDARVSIGHVHGAGLVAGVDQLDLRVERGVEDRHDVVARQCEDAARAGSLQRLDQRIGATVFAG